MRRSRPGVGSELLPVALILIGLAGTFGLVVAMHRKAAATRVAAPKAVVAVVPLPPPPEPIEAPPPPPVHVPVPPRAPVEDPTPKALARLNAQEAEQRRAAEAADRKAEALEKARQASLADAQRWRRREALVRGQVDRLADKAREAELEAESLAMERDLLARELDAARAAVVKARSHNGGYAVMPNKSANGTWQRPVMIECRDGQAVLQPSGLSFSMMDLSGALSSRSSPFVQSVGRELIRAGRANSPDGSPVVPYIYFVIRPDGIRPYYEARGRLEPLGIAFGYELVEQDWEIEFPDFDDLASWDGSSAPGPGRLNPSGGSGPERDPKNRSGGFAGTGNGPSQVASAHGFVWPEGGRGAAGAVPGNGQGTTTGESTGSGRGNADAPGGVADANGYVWPAERPGGVKGAEGLWPTLPAGAGGGGERQGLTGNSSGSSRPMPGQASGTGGRVRVPRLEEMDAEALAREGVGGLDFLGRGDNAAPGTSPPGAPGAANGGPGIQPGLVPLTPGGLPSLDRPDLPRGGNGSGGNPGLGSPPGAGNPSGGPRFDPSQLTAAPAGSTGQPGVGSLTDVTPPSGLGSADEGQVSKILKGTPPPGWVRINPGVLARAVAGDADDPDRPPALPWSAMTGGQGSPGGARGNTTGQPTGSAGSSPPQGTPGPGVPTLGAGQGGQKGDYRPRPSAAPSWSPRMTRMIDVPLDLVVACGSEGVVIHPGGYRLSRAALGKDGVLRRDLETIVRNHEMIDAGVRPRPRVQFLVEPGGGETYSEARRQTVLDGLPWPVSIQVAGAQAPSVFPKERF